jgi:hypothetical protein
MERVFHGAFDEVTCMDWSSDSRYTCVTDPLVSDESQPMIQKNQITFPTNLNMLSCLCLV